MTTGSARAFVYVANADSREISVLELEQQSGQLTLVEVVPVNGRVMPLAISPDKRLLFATLRSEPYAVQTFAIDPGSGRLSAVSTAPLPDNMAYISTDRTGRYLFGASYSGSRISVNAIGPDGTVDPAPLAVIPTGRNAHAIATDRTNRYLFVTNLGDDMIPQFRFDENTGALTPNDPPVVMAAKGEGPRHVAFHPDGRLVFCLNELDGTVTSYLLDVNGTLMPHSTVSILPEGFAGKPWAADIHLTPDGRHLYASERTSSTIAVFAIDAAEGALAVIGHVATEQQPRGFAIDPLGRHLIVAGELSGALSVYAIDRESGELRKVARTDVGQGPNWVEIIAMQGEDSDREGSRA